MSAGLTILYSEGASSNELQLLGHPETMGDDIRTLMLRGRETTAVEYLRAQSTRVQLRSAIDRAEVQLRGRQGPL